MLKHFILFGLRALTSAAPIVTLLTSMEPVDHVGPPLPTCPLPWNWAADPQDRDDDDYDEIDDDDDEIDKRGNVVQPRLLLPPTPVDIPGRGKAEGLPVPWDPLDASAESDPTLHREWRDTGKGWVPAPGPLDSLRVGLCGIDMPNPGTCVVPSKDLPAVAEHGPDGLSAEGVEEVEKVDDAEDAEDDEEDQDEKEEKEEN